ncbi:unnamed protein product [Lupinus luteus]|uniref:Allene oxide synthase n=1 Tax=Lupinus luteus TaxID=3873 RepID=A0AAV1XB90_LUPLU
MPPGPLISYESNVIVLLDGKSFPILFDVDNVEKRDVFTGTFMPSTQLTGGYRILSYLDPSEDKHDKLKRLMFFHLRSRSNHVIPEFHSTYTTLFDNLEKELAANGKVNFGELHDQAGFTFLTKSLFGTNPAETKLGRDAPKIITKWILFQLSPILSLGLPQLIEDSIFHSFRLPPALVKKDYQKLYDFFYESSGFVFDEASRLAEEIRSAVKANGGKITMAVLENMPLMKSVVYEAFRIEPPVSLQYGKAKRDLLISNHENTFKVKEGEMLFGFQPFATKDPKIFERPEEFIGDRFMGNGEKLLKHVLWSNGPENESPTVANKQCAGKDFVTLISRLLVVELFLRYDTFGIQVGKTALGSAITITSLKRASF